MNFIFLALFIIISIVYCALFHEKSIFFFASVGWFVFNIAILLSNIWFDINLAKMPAEEISAYFQNFSIFISNLKNISIILFFGIVVLFFIRKNKEITK